MNPMNPRMNPPRGPGMAPMAPGGYGPGMRAPPPNANLGPGSGPPMGPMGGPGGPRQWQPVTSAVSFLFPYFFIRIFTHFPLTELQKKIS